MAKASIKRTNDVQLQILCAKNVERKDIGQTYVNLRRSQVMETSNISMGQPDYYNESGEPFYVAATYMLQAKNASKKLLVKLPIGTAWNSLDETLTLKVDTGADENVMNEHTFRSQFKDVQLESPSIILESYGNTDV